MGSAPPNPTANTDTNTIFRFRTMASLRIPTSTDIEAANAIVTLREQGDDLAAKGRYLLSLSLNPRIRSSPEGAEQFVQATAKYREADSAYTRSVNMVRLAVQAAMREAPDNPLIRSAAAKWEAVNGSLSGPLSIPKSWRWEEMVVIAMFLLAALALLALIPAIAAALGGLGVLLALLSSIAAGTVAGVVAVGANDRATIEANIDAAAAGVEASPTISQVVTEGLGAAKVLGVAAVVGLALWLFKGRRRRG